MSRADDGLYVVHVITDLSSGGAQRMLSRVATDTHPRHGRPVRHEVVSLMDRGVYAETLEASGVAVTCLGLRGLGGVPRAIARLARLLRARRPQVVQTWLYHADFLGLLAARLAGLGAHVVWNVRCSDMRLDRYAWTTRALVRVLAALSRYPAAVVVNSRAGRRWHAELGYRPRRWVDLPNGFPTAIWTPDPDTRARRRAELGVPDTATLFVCAARVDPMKDHETLLAAFEQARNAGADVRLMLVGQGTEHAAGPLKRLDEDQTLAANVLTLGEVTHGYRALLLASDALVLPSAFGEGFPNVLGEAMCLERPCIATDVGDAAEVVGDTGRIVPPGSPAALADALSEFSAMPAARRRALGRRARQRIVRAYDLDDVLDAYGALYSEVAAVAPDRCGSADAGRHPRTLR